MQSRREFLNRASAVMAITGLAGGGALAEGITSASGRSQGHAAPFGKPTLPFAPGALAPHISAETVELHFGAHHMGYYNRLAALARTQGMEGMSLEEIVRRTHGRAGWTDVYNAAGQLLNHNLYWQSLRAPGGAGPSSGLPRAIERDFGGMARVGESLTAAAVSHFGSGWAWLVAGTTGRLSVVTSVNADSPLTEGLTPLLCIDVWEHAYYVDYRSQRAVHVAEVVRHLLNWEFASQNYLG